MVKGRAGHSPRLPSRVGGAASRGAWKLWPGRDNVWVVVTTICVVRGCAPPGPTPTNVLGSTFSFHSLRYVPGAAGAVKLTEMSAVTPGGISAGIGTLSGAPSRVPPAKTSERSASPGRPQVQVPSLRTRQVFTKAVPGVKTVLRGTVTSATRLA